jgi:hypothetical protein
MKIKELLTILKSHDPNLEIVVQGSESGYKDILDVKLQEVRIVKQNQKLFPWNGIYQISKKSKYKFKVLTII